jgi:hypothetical protein
MISALKEDRLIAYNFMAAFFVSPMMFSVDQLETAISNYTADPRCIPTFWYYDYDIDSKHRINSMWRMRYGFEIVKVKDGVVTDHHRTARLKHKEFISLDLITGKEIEFYRTDPVSWRVNKYSTATGELLSWTMPSAYSSLPEEFKVALTDFPYKDYIAYWSIKDYGRIVGVTELPPV